MLHYCVIQLHTGVASILFASASASTSPILIWFSGKLHKFAVLHENLDQRNLIPFTSTILELTKKFADLALQPTLVENMKKNLIHKDLLIHGGLMQTRDYEPWFLWNFCILLFQAPVPVRDYFTKECFLEGVATQGSLSNLWQNLSI